MITQMGLGPDGNLLWSDSPTADQEEEVNRVLRTAYDSVLQKLREREEDLTALADLLEEEQELTGEEVQDLFAGGNEPLRVSRQPATNSK
jgi:ATP-dependent Zn protease